ncbi:MAG: peptide-methionine (R)-S-oxide reductase [Verrucomicrobiota bacterium]|jgi:methionine-R-sulfoxide reductase
MATRIEHEYTSYISVVLGIIAVFAVGGGAYYFSSMRAENKKSAPYDYNKPVPTDAQLRSRLKEEQYKVTRQNGTEPAFQNEYYNNERTGLYVDIITGDPLFSSLDKFDAGNGRLNFSKPLAKDRIAQKKDLSHPEIERVEIRTVRSDSHLGHLFHDGPPPGGERYTVNSAAVKFIAVEKLANDGYGEFVSLFPGASATPKSGTP